MITHKKAPTGRKGLIKNLSQNNIRIQPHNHLNIDYQGARNPIPTEKQIIDGYWLNLEFFKDREKWHQETASWYFNYSREIEAKAGKHLDLADVAHTNYSHYLDLVGMAYLRKMEKTRGVSHV